MDLSPANSSSFIIFFILVLWVLPIPLGIRMAKRKAISPHWMWFGLHPVSGWISYFILCLRPAPETIPPQDISIQAKNNKKSRDLTPLVNLGIMLSQLQLIWLSNAMGYVGLLVLLAAGIYGILAFIGMIFFMISFKHRGTKLIFDIISCVVILLLGILSFYLYSKFDVGQWR